jgi:formylglycine-generating enzyme required for sulfatase activity
MKTIVFLAVLMITVQVEAFAQETRIVIKGIIRDSKTREPLSSATIQIKSQDIELLSTIDGVFSFFVRRADVTDTLTVSYLGYKPFKKSLMDLRDEEVVLLENYSVELQTITISSRTLRIKEIDQSLKSINTSLFAFQSETTNSWYRLFLAYLEDNDQTELLKICDYDLSSYSEVERGFFKEYNSPFKAPKNKNDTTIKNYDDFPVVNIRHEAALIFCQWLTQQYNSAPGKKKFSEVRFRLPTKEEWQIAALGYDKFQSWSLFENEVEVIITNDTLAEIQKGPKQKIRVTEDFLYPWWNHYHYRNKPRNARNCYLANFKAPPSELTCPAGKLPGYDGWTKMARTETYFPNGFGLYDMVGNVAEMINSPGFACGGSWNDSPEEATIQAVAKYSKASDKVGFRIFMDVLEQ